MGTKMTSRKPQHEELWFRWKDVGIKTFCRVGSGTIQREITASQGYYPFMEAPKKVCLVRCPWSRLLSVWHGLWPGGTMPSRGYPPIQSLEELIYYLHGLDDDEMEVHTKPMSAQLAGLWAPDDEELWDMEAFFANPPHGIPKPAQRHHQSPNVPEPQVSQTAQVMFFDRYVEDYKLWWRAMKKAPL